MRVGWGFDAHQLDDQGPLRLGGVTVSQDVGVIATSDGDVALHALTDALLGAAALGDIGMHFPSSDPQWENADSAIFVTQAVDMVSSAGLAVEGVDLTVITEEVRVAPHRDQIRQRISELLGVSLDLVSVKATTTDGLWFSSTRRGIAAAAVVTLGPAAS